MQKTAMNTGGNVNISISGVTDYHTAMRFIQGGRNRTYRRVPRMRATALSVTESGAVAVKYHGTAVVIYLPTGGVVLNSGGFATQTTKRRINAFAQQNLRICKGKLIFPNGQIFVDGMRIGMIRQHALDFAS